ncbi:MAG: NAD(P)-dependent oxidoreductase [Chloroflexi bacterium]|nr:NAD(P)-dependent oxidoreductase [Chloroflexota bacterium]
MTTVAILGVGRMGGAMARSIARAGFPVVLSNRSVDRAVALAAELGDTARAVDSAAEAAAAADVCISMVSDGAAVEALYRGPGGVLEGLRAGSVAIDSSTVPPSVSRGLAADVRARGADLLDAPVSGSVTLAETGKLTALVGGETATVERARPVLDAFAARVFHMGPLGSGAVIKLAVNAIIFGLNHSVAEALVLAERAGVDRATAYEVFMASAIGAPLVQYKRDSFVTPETAAVAFSLALAAKDLSLIGQLADEVGAQIPQARLDAAVIDAATAALPGGPDRDMADVAQHLRRDAAD